MISKHAKIIATSAGVILVLAVSVVFITGGQERTVVGNYRLEQWEDFTTYYLHKRGLDDSLQGGSFIGGIVVRIGWTSRYIATERRSFYRGDPDGWMIIDVNSGAMIGPFSYDEFRARPESEGVQIYTAAEAWKKL